MKVTLKSLLLLVHYWFPVVLGWSIAIVVHRANGWPILPSGIALYLLGICAAYSFDRLLDNDVSSRPRWLTIALLLGFSLSSVLGFFLAIHTSLQTFSALLIFSIITLIYSRVKKFPFLKFLLVSIVWIWSGVALPFGNQHWFAWQFWTMRISVPLVMLFVGGCILCDFKDVKSDRVTGVQSLPVMYGLQNTIWVTSILLVATAVVSFYEHRLGLVASSAILVVLAQFPNILSLDAIGPLIVDAALAIPGFLIVLHLI